MLAGQLLAEAGTPAQCSRWLPTLASGNLRLALAFGEADSRYDLARVAATARMVNGAYRIDGRKTLVLDGDTADVFFIVARSAGATHEPHGLTLFTAEAKARGVRVQPFATLDGRGAAHVEFDGVQVSADAVIGTPGEALPLLEAAVDRAAAALCAEAAGAIEALLDLTAEHLRSRKQFGAPLAKFQVLQHRVAAVDRVGAGEVDGLRRGDGGGCGRTAATPPDRPRREGLDRPTPAARWASPSITRAMGMTDECRAGHYASACS